MKRLYLIRHAKSSWKDSNIDDFDRPLNKRGKRDAPLIANSFTTRNIKPDIIISSPARRTKKTAKILRKNINLDKKIAYCKKLYDCFYIKSEELSKFVKPNHNEVAIVGHNPELTVFACSFVDFEKNIPTAGVVGIEFDCKKWSEINYKNAKLMFFDYPKKDKCQK